MIRPNMMKSALGLAMVTGLVGLGVSAAFAQGSPYSNGPTESVEVIAPRFHADSAPLNGPMEKVSYSERVRYDDLNLLTRRLWTSLWWMNPARWRLRPKTSPPLTSPSRSGEGGNRSPEEQNESAFPPAPAPKRGQQGAGDGERSAPEPVGATPP